MGLSQILEVAGIPKGSFYHYFASKEAFGEELLRSYMHDYLINIHALFATPDKNGAQKLFSYLDFWRCSHIKGQVGDKCLIVKLAAEVSDISERMRRIMETGTASVITHLSQVIKTGQEDGSVQSTLPAHKLASSLYQLWLGATLMTKITHSSHPMDEAWQTSLTFWVAPQIRSIQPHGRANNGFHHISKDGSQAAYPAKQFYLMLTIQHNMAYAG